MFEILGKYNKAKIFADSVDNETISQIMDICNQEWAKNSHIAIMPDCHAGKGCTIGTTMTVTNKVCPNLVGVDIGCGMLTIEIPKELSDLSLEKLDHFIHQQIPSGFDINSKIMYNPQFDHLHLEELRCFDQLKNVEGLKRSVGSLGGGNHFIEIDVDDEGMKYLVIHTGSRNLGKQVAEYYQDMAYNDCNRLLESRNQELNLLITKLKNEGRHSEIEAEIKKFNENYISVDKLPKDLCYLEGYHLEDYLHDMDICQKYAQLNRKTIAKRIIEYLCKEKNISNISYNSFETIHNYIDLNHMILRKGAISAQKDEIVLIPINMKDGAIIAKGKGNSEYNYSGPHGAGRLLSRSEAKKQISLEEFQESMKGIYSTSVLPSTLDESPMAYKPIEEILKNIDDTVEVIKIIKPIYNFKAH